MNRRRLREQRGSETTNLNCLLVRKSKVQFQSVVLKPRLLSLPVSFIEETVLNAELKSANSILI